jgi:pimeloyl-ACP methyl ester carboxylesterase
MAATIVQNFISAAGVYTHYRRAGKGPLLVLLHPSPRSSKLMEPLMQLLATTFTVVAPDTPGYGASTALPQRATDLADYLPWLHAFITSFTDEPVILYGTATGAQLAIAYALSYPGALRHLYVDNTAHVEEKEREEIIQQYFPDFSPQADGSHLPKIWQHVCASCLFFPWYHQREENRIAPALPPAALLQDIVTDYVLAGAHYADAYRAAFLHERAEKLQQLTIPTTIFRWLGSPLLKYIDALLAHELPPNISRVETPADMRARFAQMQAVICARP